MRRNLGLLILGALAAAIGVATTPEREPLRPESAWTGVAAVLVMAGALLAVVSLVRIALQLIRGD